MLKRAARSLATGPEGAVLLFALGLRLFAVMWGLPSSDGWDNDGIAPRDFLVITAETYWRGHFATYPPVHAVLLSLLTAPIWLARALTAPHLDVQAFIHVPTMTALAVVARLVTVAMSLGLIAALAKLGEEIAGRTAGVCVAIAAAVSAPFVYYSQTSNLDVPALFWGALSLLELVRLVARHEPLRMRRMLAFAILAVGTKDQAYALFLLTFPATLALWCAVDPWAKERARSTLRAFVATAFIALLLLLVIDGALANPRGFHDRVQFLLGPASQDHVGYVNSLRGRLSAAEDVVRFFPRFYPMALAPLALAGMVLPPLRAKSRGALVASLVPLLAMLSFTLFFNMAARRVEHRFVLPQALLAAVYIGVGAAALVTAKDRVLAVAARLYTTTYAAVALFMALSVDAAFLQDPRYDAERWLREHVQPGDSIEIYGNNVYLPRLPAAAKVSRIDRGDRSPAARRSPLPGVVEVEDTFGNIEARRPRFVVLSEGWWVHYVHDAPGGRGADGRAFSPYDVAASADADVHAFVLDLLAGRLAYRLARVSRYEPGLFPKVEIHRSLEQEVRIYERVSGM